MVHLCKILIIAGILVILESSSCKVRKTGEVNYYGYDARLYQNTPVWELVNALNNANWNEAIIILKNDSALANYAESTYGNPVLFWAVLNKSDKAVDILLTFGADANKMNHFSESSVELAAYFPPCDNSIFSKILMNQYKDDSMTIILRNEALVGASKKCLKNVKILIEYGADPYWVSLKDSFMKTNTPLEAATIQQKYDIVEYYIKELGVDPASGVLVKIDGDTVTVKESLQRDYYAYYTKDEQKKQIKKILDLLEAKNLKKIEFLN